MAICVKCEAMLGVHSKHRPHEEQVLIETNQTSAYLQPGPERYRCSLCGTTLERDMDRRDPEAVWRLAPPV